MIASMLVLNPEQTVTVPLTAVQKSVNTELYEKFLPRTQYKHDYHTPQSPVEAHQLLYQTNYYYNTLSMKKHTIKRKFDFFSLFFLNLPSRLLNGDLSLLRKAR